MRQEDPNSIRPVANSREKDKTDRETCIDASDVEGQGVGSESIEEEAQAAEEREEQTGGEDIEAECQECDPKNTDKRLKSPGAPSAIERAIHETNHWPFRSWCDACVKGRATGQQHRSMVGEYAESNVARVLMDYGFLHEEESVQETEHGKETESKVSMTILVMVETMCASIWAYALEGKGAASVDWAAQQVVDDMEIVGLPRERVITKTD